ncbi:MAG TPA: hypothetical protein VF444_23455 [Pseudonocardiaceae bacterium]
MSARRLALDTDEQLLTVHEIGHGIVNVALGLAVASVTVDLRDGTGATLLAVEIGEDSPRELQAAYQVSALAGYEAEVLWAAQHGGRASKRGSAIDFQHFREARRGGRLWESDARARARKILRQQWNQVERLVPILAERGRLSPSELRAPKRWWS